MTKERILRYQIHQWLFRGKALVITGVRQVGKTTLLEEMFLQRVDTLWLNADDASIRERIRLNTGIVRKKGADFLVYRLIDVVVDNYFTVMEHIEEKLDNLEELITTDNQHDHMGDIQDVKREMLRLRRAILPLREAVGALEKGVAGLVLPNNQKYYKDIHDHLVQLIDSVENGREVLGMVMDLYLANMNNRMNNVMKVLTVVSTIFIPLTFIVGVYGMNFDNMPELRWHNGYYMIMAFMAIVAVVMLVFFRRKKWL